MADDSEVIVDPVEEQARSAGWIPLDEWTAAGNDEASHRTAKEFNARGELFEKINNQSKKIRNLEDSLTRLAEHHRKYSEGEHNRILKALEQDRTAALLNKDIDQVNAIEAEIKTHNEHKPEPPPAVVTATEHPEFEEFKAKNPWYESDKELKEEADIIGLGYAQKNPNATPLEVYAEVVKKVKRNFPEKFKQQGVNNATTRPNTTTSQRVGGGGNKFTIDNVPEEYRRAAITFVKHGAFKTEQAYIDQLVANGDLK